VEIIKILLGTAMSVDLTDGDESTPLHVSDKCGNLEVTKAFDEKGVLLHNV